jgi:hypothetical protein
MQHSSLKAIFCAGIVLFLFSAGIERFAVKRMCFSGTEEQDGEF